MRMLCLTRYDRAGSSSRYRFYQFLPGLRALGWHVDASYLLGDGYVDALYEKRRLGAQFFVASAMRRLTALSRAREYDLVWIEKELFPYLPALLERALNRFRVRYVVDLDDAIFHQYQEHHSALVRATLGRKIERVMRGAALVIAGNDYIAEHALAAGARRVDVIPTVIDLTHYTVQKPPRRGPPVVGWIGSPSTQSSLTALAGVLSRFCGDTGATVRAIGAHRKFSLPGVPLQIVPWSEETEVEEIAAFDVGIMPLRDDPWSRGKCGFKLIQYMGCRLPVIASPIGANRAIVVHRETGWLASSEDEWGAALRAIAREPALGVQMGFAGRARVEQHYSLTVALPRLASALVAVAKPRLPSV